MFVSWKGIKVLDWIVLPPGRCEMSYSLILLSFKLKPTAIKTKYENMVLLMWFLMHMA
jgi:hypothetical protein